MNYCIFDIMFGDAWNVCKGASMPRLSISLVLGCALIVVGCAGVGVIQSSDPNTKLSDATILFDREDRPLIAERLIREAIEICAKKLDQNCLADAYTNYGFFFRSPSVVHWSKQYIENGFLDTSATYDNRYSKSIEYFERARAIYPQLGRFDALTNVDLNMGITYELMGDRKSACQALADSADANHENLRRNPSTTVALPKGFSSYDDFLADYRKRDRCE
jgi:tetratricopeptide (TPR) repeat protein